jgi:hypothetical protein
LLPLECAALTKKPTPFSIPARQAANAQNPCGEGIYPRWAAQQPQTANAVCLIDRKLTEIFFLIEATDFYQIYGVDNDERK